MLRIVVSVHNEDSAPDCDLEIPAEAPAEELDQLISRALAWDADPNSQPLRHTITVTATGRRLSHQETLAEVECWDGNSLRLDSFVAAYLQSASTTYSLYCPDVMLGRKETEGWQGDSLVVLANEPRSATVSLQHAQLTNTKGQWQISHLSKPNETVLNGHSLAIGDRLSLRDGDKIELGAVHLTFHIGPTPV